MSMDNLTFRDFYLYIQEASRDSKGYHYPISTQVYPVWIFHIYEGRLQVNINRKDGPDMMAWAKADVIFYPDEGKVRLVRVNNCIADYDEENYISIDTPLSDDNWKELLVDRMRRESDYDVINAIQEVIIITVKSWYKYHGDPNDTLELEPAVKEIVTDRLHASGFANDMVDAISDVITPVIADAMTEIISATARVMTDILIDHSDKYVEVKNSVTT